MFNIEDILLATGGQLVSGETALTVSRVSIDSRQCCAGDLFIAIKGDHCDGHDYLDQAFEKGVRCFVVSRKVRFLHDSATVIKVVETTRALGDIARYHRQRFSIPFIAITGSAGKTTTKELIAALLRTQYHVLNNEASFNNQIGVPLTLLRLSASHEVAVIEIGTSQPGDIDYLANIVKPQIAILTNIAKAHLAGLKDCAGIYKEKTQLIKALSRAGTVIYNEDDLYLRKISTLSIPQKKIRFSIDAPSDSQACGIKRLRNGVMQFEIHGQSLRYRALSRRFIYNANAAICCARLFDISDRHIQEVLARPPECAGRMKIISKKTGVLIDDTYNANLLSLQAAVEALDNFSTKGKKIFVLGDMLEMGRTSRRCHRDASSFFENRHIDILITFGNDSKALSDALKNKRELKVAHYQTMTPLLRRLGVIWKKGDAVCVKGSHAMRMERVASFIKDRLNRLA